MTFDGTLDGSSKRARIVSLSSPSLVPARTLRPLQYRIIFDERKFSFCGRAVVILLEAVLRNEDGPVFGFVQYVYTSGMPAADGARPVVVETGSRLSSAIFIANLARPFRGATSGGKGANYEFACSPARVLIITARYLNAVALNTATGVWLHQRWIAPRRAGAFIIAAARPPIRAPLPIVRFARKSRHPRSRLRHRRRWLENDFKPPKWSLNSCAMNSPTVSGSPLSRCCQISLAAYHG